MSTCLLAGKFNYLMWSADCSVDGFSMGGRELQTVPLVLWNLDNVRGEGKECKACSAGEDRAFLITGQSLNKWVAI